MLNGTNKTYTDKMATQEQLYWSHSNGWKWEVQSASSKYQNLVSCLQPRAAP